MSRLRFPSGRSIFENKTLSREFLELTLSEIQGAGEFTGYLKSERGEIQDILFFLKGRPYAAGRVEGQRPLSLTIREFFDELPKGGSEPALLSLHEIDPVLFKGMLVYLQREPSIKASTRLLNIDEITEDIKARSSGALVILKKEDRMNFFFFFKGEAVKCHYAETADEKAISSPVMEQLVLYAYPRGTAHVDAFVYLDISTYQAADADNSGEVELIELPLRTVEKQAAAPPPQVVLSVVAGPDRDREITVPLPCVIGRKEGDLILGDRTVSGRHALMRRSGGSLVIEDLGSTNGTYVNGFEIRARELLGGELITLGETSLRVESITFSEEQG